MDKNQPKMSEYDILLESDNGEYSYQNNRICPICSGEVIIESRCAYCIECGWSLCVN